MSDEEEFASSRDAAMSKMAEDRAFAAVTADWFVRSAAHRYSYNFSWLGRPIIQYPQDIVAMQELIWETRPEVIVETGIARGGSLVFYASMLELLGGDGRVVGVDIDIRPHNRAAIEAHPMARRIDLIEGSSVDPDIAAAVRDATTGHERVMVVLDSHHTHEHVSRELDLYSPLVGSGGYVVVFDTVIEAMPTGSFPDRDWDVGDNPATAVRAFLERNDRFEVDRRMDMKLGISVAPGGYLRCVKA